MVRLVISSVGMSFSLWSRDLSQRRRQRTSSRFSNRTKSHIRVPLGTFRINNLERGEVSLILFIIAGNFFEPSRFIDVFTVYSVIASSNIGIE